MRYSIDDAAGIRRAAQEAALILSEAAQRCRAGITTGELEALIRGDILSSGARSLFDDRSRAGSPAFPGCACFSVNEEVTHGVPGPRVLARGDVVSIDLGLDLDGWCADVATTVIVGESGGDSVAASLVRTTRELVRHAVEMIAPGVAWATIARELERRSAVGGFGVVTEFAGHGIGRSLHEPPTAPAYWTGFDGSDFVLEAGMVLTVEPILCAPREGRYPPANDGGLIRTPVHLGGDGWTVRTSDGSIAAHEERMVLVRKGGAKVLSVVE
ncbi:MAG: type I methionyl aminopeptidase [Phycisphaerae bacterium]|nr:type I methionyl aminopeptidase [Phycisphaerae bacterium]